MNSAGANLGGVLEGVKVLDFSFLLPGPLASMFLADMGADVVRIEAPNRPDAMRLRPPFDGKTSAWHGLLNRSKRTMTLDLKKPGASDVVKQLVQTYDIVLEQFRPGVMDRLGVGYEDLRTANPRLIYCAITGYGQEGPYRDRAGHDLNYVALSGLASFTGRRGHGPLPLPVQLADVGGSYNALVGILAADIHRRQTGEGQYIDVSLLDAAISWGGLAASTYLVGGVEPEQEGMLVNRGAAYDYYKTRDGRYFSIAGLEPKFWSGFCAAIGRSDLVEAGTSTDPAKREELRTEIATTIASCTYAEWLEVFAAVDVCVEPVLTVGEMLQHPQTLARDIIVDVPRPDGGAQKQVGIPIKFSKSTSTYRHIGAESAAHTDQVLAEVGYTETEIATLRAAGVLG